ncbi:MAG: L,D-transpeptidase family protein [Solirubrobacteraceae bacterium]|nr:L,D-transpeptidase family protein [Solirubrobacteraceae bacterium]
MNRPLAGPALALSAVTPLLVLAAPSVAGAQAPAAPAPLTAPAPVATTLKITTERARDGRALKGDRWRVLVTTGRFVEGTRVDVSLTVDGKERPVKSLPLKRSRKGGKGVARTVYVNSRATRVVVRAAIAPGQPIAPVQAKTKVVVQSTPSVKAGARGYAVERLQEMLDAKGYVVGRKGVYDARTQRAVLAFRKVTRRTWNHTADRSIFRALQRGEGRFRVRFKSHGRHVEGDIRRQVLALIGEGGKVERIYHTSPGKPSTPTIRGSYRVYMKEPGTNSVGMYMSSYFIRGYAIHGYKSVPLYNASAGCFRVPMQDAVSIYNWIRHGTRVDTYV